MNDCIFPFSRGLRHRRYDRIALRGFWAEGRERRAKEFIFPHLSRGLRHHRYPCVALRGLILLILKSLNPRFEKEILVSKTQICRPAGTFIFIFYCAGLKTRR